MCQLMGNQPPPLVRPRCITSCAEYNIVSKRVGSGVYVARRLLGGATGMHPHVAEVVAEAGLEKGARCLRQRLAAALPQRAHLGRQAGRRLRSLSANRFGLDSRPLLLWLSLPLHQRRDRVSQRFRLDGSSSSSGSIWRWLGEAGICIT